MTEIKQRVEENLIEIKRRKENINKLYKLINIFLPSLILIIIFSIFIGIASIKGNSMNNTLYDGDIVIYNRITMSYNYGDIIVAKKNNQNKNIIKRIIGLPGDTINIIDGKVYVNGTILEENYINTITEVYDVTFPLTLKEDEYFVLGDNRNNSLDSRSSETGNILKSQLKGKVFFISRLFH